VRNPYRKIVFMQWLVIAVLVIGAAVGGYLLVHKLNSLQDDNTTLSGERDDLQNQLNQAQASASPSPSATPSPSPSSSPSPTAIPTPTRSPATR
jgi:hypothetical protein